MLSSFIIENRSSSKWRASVSSLGSTALTSSRS
jgi:hypothetical protein